MNYLYWLSQIQALEQSLVGEQVFLLSQLLQQDYPIIPGFVVSNTLFKKFLANLDDSRFLVSNVANSSLHLDIDDYQVLQAIAIKSRQAIEETALAPQWQEEILAAAKQLKTQHLILRPFFFPCHYPQQDINSLWHSQTCFCTAKTLTIALKKVWSELFSAKSLLYWYKLNIPLAEISCSVLIQPIENAIASGILELRPKTIFIQATWGLADSLNQGAVEPDTYILDRATGEVINQKLGQKTCAYGLVINQDVKDLKSSIDSYFLTESQSETYSLTASELKQLVKLTAILSHKRPQIRYLEWTLSNRENQVDSLPQFYWTQLNYFSPFAFASDQVSLPSTAKSVQPLLRGLGVSYGKTLGKVLVLDKPTLEPSSLPDQYILVSKNILLSQINFSKQIQGIIAEGGGITSHAAIIARELGIPAIFNANHATTILKTGDVVMLDGDRGEVHYADVAHQLLDEPPPIMPKSFTIPQALATRVMLNLNNSHTIEQAQQLPVDGVGLLRGELMLRELLTSRSLEQWLIQPNQQEFLAHLTNLLRQFVVAFAPRPVFYRSCDGNSREFSDSKELEPNPIVGDRGTYHYLLDSTLFDLELQAISTIQQEGYTNINLILPFVRSVSEFTFCHQRVENFGLSKITSFQLWLMAEVPSVIYLLPQYIQAGVQGIIIGANDLTQLMLGVDRECADFSRLGLNINHPAVLDSIYQLSQIAKKHHIPCAISIHNPVQYPNLLDKLIQWDISLISVELEAIISTYQEIARSEKRLILNMVRDSHQC